MSGYLVFSVCQPFTLTLCMDFSYLDYYFSSIDYNQSKKRHITLHTFDSRWNNNFF